MYNNLKCYYTSLKILLSPSLSCNSVLPMDHKDNFTTGLHTPVKYLLKRDHHVH